MTERLLVRSEPVEWAFKWDGNVAYKRAGEVNWKTWLPHLKYCLPPEVFDKCREVYEKNRPLADDEVRKPNGAILKMTISAGDHVSVGGRHCYSRAWLRENLSSAHFHQAQFQRIKAFLEANRPKKGERKVFIDVAVKCTVDCVQITSSYSTTSLLSPSKARELAAHIVECADAAETSS